MSKEYESDLRDLQIELIKLQKQLVSKGERLLILVEGRDGGGKDGLIRTITEHLSPRMTRIVALGKPTETERTSWYFQRYVSHLPAAGQMVLFNRSWYNRAGVERVMDFCTKAEYQAFMASVVPFELMLEDAGIRIFKYYLDISKSEQKKRLDARRADPLKQWKIGPIDEVALEKFDDYSDARDRMLEETSVKRSPWLVVRADNKKETRLNVIRHLLSEHSYKGKDDSILKVDKSVLIKFDKCELKSLAR